MSESTKYIDPNGNLWYLDKDRLPHRIDGPAVIYVDGSKMWYRHGCLHRLDGPAREWYNGSEDYFIGNKQYDKHKYYIKIAEMNNYYKPKKKSRFQMLEIK